MSREAHWQPFGNGGSLGQRGSENGIILRDEEHPDGARIALERDGYCPFAITCGLYGWMVHTRFFSTEAAARQAFEEMKGELADILGLIPLEGGPESEGQVSAVIKAISDFVEKFP